MVHRAEGKGIKGIEQGDLKPEYLFSVICFLSSDIRLRGGFCGHRAQRIGHYLEGKNQEF
jgi:hypothetical protein